ncbi:MAG: SecDF P1 head subdomain-containing protein [Armatimonadota bacterium]
MIQSIPNTELEPLKKPANRIWISVVLAVIVIAVGGLLFMRQNSTSPAPAVVKAAPSLEKVSSYHLKYKVTYDYPDMRKHISYHELWYQSPADWKLEISGNKSKTMQMMRDGIEWWYTEGSGVAVRTPASDKELSQNINFPFFREIPKGFKKIGTRIVGGHDSDVFESDSPKDQHMIICVDRITGIFLQLLDSNKGKVMHKKEIISFKVNKPLPQEIFATRFPTGTMIINATEINRGFNHLDIETIKSIADFGNNEYPYAESSFQELADIGVTSKARLKRIYEPNYLPEGYTKFFVASNGERITRPDGIIENSLTGKYSSIFADSINPKTGDTIFFAENADKFDKEEGREITDGDFRGRIAVHEKPFPYTELFWQDEGVYFNLSATALSEQEIVKVARSMRLVEPTPQKPSVSRKPSNSKIAGKLEFRYLSGVKTQKHPNAKYNMNMSKDNDGKDTYEFIDSKGKTVDAKKVIDESPLILSEADLKPVSEVVPGYQANPVISIEFTPEGRKKFADFTRKHIDEYLAIIVDGRILSAPVIRAPILDGKAVIEGSFKDQEAQSLADALNKGGSVKR